MRRLKWLSLPLVACLLNGQSAHFRNTPDPLLNYFADPPNVYTFLNSDTGKETAVRIAFPSFTRKVTVTNPPGFTFLRQSASENPGATSMMRGPIVKQGGGFDLPDPDEFQFDPWDDPPEPVDMPFPPDDPFEDLPLPPLPPDDPFDGLPDPPLDLPPLPGGDLPGSDYSPGSVNVPNVSGASGGQSLPAPINGVKTTAAVSVRSVQVGPSPAGFVISPDGLTFYVAVSGNGTIAVIDRKTLTIKSRFTLPAGTQPYALAITPDGSRLYTGEFAQGTAAAYSIDIASGVIKKLAVTGSYMTQAIVTADGTQVWFCNYFGNVQIYDVLTNAYITTIQISNPWNVAFSANGTRAYITNGAANVPGSVAVYDVSSLRQIANVPVGITPRAIRLSPTGRHLFVTNYGSNFVSQIDVRTNTVVRSIPIGGTGASGLWFTNN